MLLKSRGIAVLGMLTAVSVILISLAGIIETNSLFFIVSASFIIGLGMRLTNRYYGIGMFVASLLLSLILAPNKLYCLTYSFFGIYLIGSEFLFEWIARQDKIIHKHRALTISKAILFNTFYIPVVFFLPNLLMNIEKQEQTLWIQLVALVLGQFFLVIFEYAYAYLHVQLERNKFFDFWNNK